jgi:hypothetical protein
MLLLTVSCTATTLEKHGVHVAVLQAVGNCAMPKDRTKRFADLTYRTLSHRCDKVEVVATYGLKGEAWNLVDVVVLNPSSAEEAERIAQRALSSVGPCEESKLSAARVGRQIYSCSHDALSVSRSNANGVLTVQFKVESL